MPATTGTEICQDAFALLNVFLPGEAMAPQDGSYALRQLNNLLSLSAQRARMIPIVSRNEFAMVSGQGGPSFPYTIGVGGNFNVPKPANQNSIVSANLVLTVSVPAVRVPLGIYTDDAYNANAIPDLANSQPTGLYYNPTYQGDLGSIFLWPVPNVSFNILEIFIQQAVAQFVDLSTTYYVPDGWKEMLEYNLADRLQTAYGKQLSQAAQRLAVSSMGVVTRVNTKLSDLMNDASWTANRQTYFNILTGNGGA
jgi:hypothetical protein